MDRLRITGDQRMAGVGNLPGAERSSVGLWERDFFGKPGGYPDCERRAHGGPLVQRRRWIRAEFGVAAQSEPANLKFAIFGDTSGWREQPGPGDHQEHAAERRSP